MPLEDYRVLERVGQGAQGTVYRAAHIPTGDIVAMKRIPVSGLTEAEKAAALQEVRVLSTLKHDPCPYVMGYTESFIDAKEKDLCLVLEWSSEGTLHDTIDTHNAKWKETHTPKYTEQRPMKGFGGEKPLGVVGGPSPIIASPQSTFVRQPSSRVAPPSGSTPVNSTSDIPPPMLTEGEVWRAFLSVSAALFHVHCQNILHRDVKMANVFLHSSSSSSGVTKVAGGSSSSSSSMPQSLTSPVSKRDAAAVIAAIAATKQPANRRKITVDRVQLGDFGVSTILADRSNALTMVGTPYFFSPELCMGRPYSGKSDIWSLGVMLFAMLFNRLPFEAANYGALILRIVRQEGGDVVVALQKQLTASGMVMYSPILYKLCTWCLQKKDSSRPTAFDVLCHPACLQQCLDQGLELPPAVLQNQAAIAGLNRAHRVRVPTQVHESSAAAAQEYLQSIEEAKKNGKQQQAALLTLLNTPVSAAAQASVCSSPVLPKDHSPSIPVPTADAGKKSPKNSAFATTPPSTAPSTHQCVLVNDGGNDNVETDIKKGPGDGCGIVPDVPPSERPLPLFNKGAGGNHPSKKVRLQRGKTVPHPDDRTISARTASRAAAAGGGRIGGAAHTIHTGTLSTKVPTRRSPRTPSTSKPPIVCYDTVNLPSSQSSLTCGQRIPTSEEKIRQQERQRAREAEEVRALDDGDDDDESDEDEGEGSSVPHEVDEVDEDEDDGETDQVVFGKSREVYHSEDRNGLLSAMAAAMRPSTSQPQQQQKQVIVVPKSVSSPPPPRPPPRPYLSKRKGIPPIQSSDVPQPPPAAAVGSAGASRVVRSAGSVSGDQMRALRKGSDLVVTGGRGDTRKDQQNATVVNTNTNISGVVDVDETDMLYASAGAVNMQPDELRDMLMGAGHADYVEWCEAAGREREMLLLANWDEEDGLQLDSTNGLQATPFIVYEPGSSGRGGYNHNDEDEIADVAAVTWRVVDDSMILHASESHPSSLNGSLRHHHHNSHPPNPPPSALRCDLASTSGTIGGYNTTMGGGLSTVVVERTDRSWNHTTTIPNLNIPINRTEGGGGGGVSAGGGFSSTPSSARFARSPIRGGGGGRRNSGLPVQPIADYFRQHSMLSNPSTARSVAGGGRPMLTGRSVPDTARGLATTHTLDSVDDIAEMLLQVSNEAEEMAGGPAHLAEVLEVLTRGMGGWDDEDGDEEGVRVDMNDTPFGGLSDTVTSCTSNHSTTSSSTLHSTRLASTVNITDLMQRRRRDVVAASEGGDTAAAAAGSHEAVVQMLATMGITDERTQGSLLHLCFRFLFLEGQQRKLIRDLANPEAVRIAASRK